MDIITLAMAKKEVEKVNRKVDLIMSFLEESINNENSNNERFKKLKEEIEKQ